MGNPLKWIKKNVKKTWDEGAEWFSDAGECFKHGNVWGGIVNGAAGVVTDVFGTATLGTTTAAGDALSDTIDESSIGEFLVERKLGEEERNEKCAQGWKDTQEYFSLAGDHFKNGNFFGGLYQGSMGVMGNVGNGVTLGQAGIWGENLEDAIDWEAEGDEIKFKEGKENLATRYLARMAKGRADSEVLQQQCEELGMTGYANLMGAVDCGSLALDIYTGTSLIHVAKAPIKKIAGQGIKQAAKSATKKGVQQWVGTTVKKGLITASVAQICSAEVNSMIKDTQEGGIGHAVRNQLNKQMGNVAGDVTSVVGDTVDAFSSWLSKHPLIARNVNTAKGIGHATVATLGGTAVVSNVAAWGKKFFDFNHNYDGSSVSAIAEDVRRRSNSGNKSFMESYIESVKENDKKCNLDAKDRLFVGNIISGGADNSAEPEMG